MLGNRIGVISCSGEECLGGTISRLAVRKMMEELKPGMVSTLCLPLFIAGDGGEREFAEKYPTIAVDGCSKCCAKRAIEKYSSAVAGSIDVAEIIGEAKALEKPLSTRHITDLHMEYVNQTAAKTCEIFDEILAKQ
ncbi:putative zinc-binding protein [uncultured Acetobacterium sp.]|uniref:putative zinc-binding protein n=1 Tax=uncultured Acetobacterium sp. TaxID=217139 RepID=UPI0025D73AC2|nr:putative zinc-binding protein [uncultured Acetobacterium sp.]